MTDVTHNFTLNSYIPIWHTAGSHCLPEVPLEGSV